jgi:hypothetical protein
VLTLELGTVAGGGAGTARELGVGRGGGWGFVRGRHWWVTLRDCGVALCDCWVMLRARWVTLRARWVTLRARVCEHADMQWERDALREGFRTFRERTPTPNLRHLMKAPRTALWQSITMDSHTFVLTEQHPEGGRLHRWTPKVRAPG